MLTKIDMDIPLELLGLSDIKLTEINLRNKRELIIKDQQPTPQGAGYGQNRVSC
jgi:hypothetical protein